MKKEHIRAQAVDLLERGFYSIIFQPICNARERCTIGYEALFRGPKGTVLESPLTLFHKKGFLPPELLVQADMACIEMAIRQGKHFAGDLLLFINIHGITLKQIADDHRIFQILLDRLHINPGRIVLEISETTACIDAVHTGRYLVLLKRMGIRFALDDIGHSSTWLQHMLILNPEFIKLERVLISEIDKSEKKQNLLNGLLVLAQSVGASVIAEGVETEGEMELVGKLGVPYAQGYHLGVPQPAEIWVGGYKKMNNYPAILDEREEDRKWL